MPTVPDMALEKREENQLFVTYQQHTRAHAEVFSEAAVETEWRLQEDNWSKAQEEPHTHIV